MLEEINNKSVYETPILIEFQISEETNSGDVNLKETDSGAGLFS